MVKPSLPVHTETGNPIDFMRLPDDVRDWFPAHLAEFMAKNPSMSELEARLRLGQKARYVLTGRWVELRWDHWLEPTKEGPAVSRNAFIVELYQAGPAPTKFAFDNVDDAFACWDRYERRWAIEIAEKALGLL